MEQRWKVLLITSVGLFMASLDLFIVNIAFPDLARDFNGASLPSLSWVLNAYAIVFAALLVPAGRIADRVGRKRVFIAGLLLFSAASALCALAPSVPFLVGARVLQAAGGAMMLPTTLGLILPAFPPAQRPLAIGIWSAVGGVAAALGPPIGGLLVQLGLALDLRRQRADRGRSPRSSPGAPCRRCASPKTAAPTCSAPPSWRSASACSPSASSRAPSGAGPTRAPSPPSPPRSRLVVAFVVRSGRHEAPVIELPLLRVRSFALANLAAMVFFAGFGAMLLSGVLLLTEVWGYSALKAGLALSPGPLDRGDLRHPLGAARRPHRPAPGRRRGRPHLRRRLRRDPRHGRQRTGLRVELPARLRARRRRRRHGPGDAPGRGHRRPPPSRFATGTAVFGMARQLGSAIGVAVLIALLDDSTGGDLLAGLQRGWAFALGAGLGTAALALAFGPAVRPAAQPHSRADARQPSAELATQRGVA